MAVQVFLKFVDEAGNEIPQEVDPKKRDKRKKRWAKLLEWIGIGLGAWDIIVSLGSGGGGLPGGFRVKRIEIKEVNAQKTQF